MQSRAAFATSQTLEFSLDNLKLPVPIAWTTEFLQGSNYKLLNMHLSRQSGWKSSPTSTTISRTKLAYMYMITLTAASFSHILAATSQSYPAFTDRQAWTGQLWDGCACTQSHHWGAGCMQTSQEDRHEQVGHSANKQLVHDDVFRISSNNPVCLHRGSEQNTMQADQTAHTPYVTHVYICDLSLHLFRQSLLLLYQLAAMTGLQIRISLQQPASY